ncbi:MAG: glycosyltransferase family 9 protein [Bacteroidetes bacterium]|nr:glycosyltransferase family 9 protein [Bacteroidota bacterium]
MSYKKAIVRFEYFSKNLIINRIRHLLFKPISSYQSGKILIFRTGSIGDSICALPALNLIRLNFPNAEISLLTNPGSKNISIEYLIDPVLNFEIINYYGGSKADLFRKLRSERFEMFIELPQTFEPFSTQVRNMLFAKSIGVKIGLGWELISTRTFSKFQERNTNFINVRDRYLRLLRKEGMREHPPSYPLAISSEMKSEIEKQLSSLNLLRQEKNIAIVIGAKRRTNRWPIELFKELIQAASERGLNCLLIGSKEDDEIARPVVGLPKVYNFCGLYTPLESAVIMSKCIITISNDTGPMHLSYAVGTPVIALFSARDYPIQWYPPASSGSVVLRSFVEPCSPCFLEECPYDNRCMRRITSEMVITELDKKINDKLEGKVN